MPDRTGQREKSTVVWTVGPLQNKSRKRQALAFSMRTSAFLHPRFTHRKHEIHPPSHATDHIPADAQRSVLLHAQSEDPRSEPCRKSAAAGTNPKLRKQKKGEYMKKGFPASCSR